jgi:hypothetical protein
MIWPGSDNCSHVAANGGGGTHTFLLLKTLVETGCDVTLFGNEDSNDYPDLACINYTLVPLRKSIGYKGMTEGFSKEKDRLKSFDLMIIVGMVKQPIIEMICEYKVPVVQVPFGPNKEFKVIIESFLKRNPETFLAYFDTSAMYEYYKKVFKRDDIFAWQYTPVEVFRESHSYTDRYYTFSRIIVEKIVHNAADLADRLNLDVEIYGCIDNEKYTRERISKFKERYKGYIGVSTFFGQPVIPGVHMQTSIMEGGLATPVQALTHGVPVIMNIDLHHLIKNDILGEVLEKGPDYELFGSGVSINYQTIDQDTWNYVEKYVRAICENRGAVREYAEKFHMKNYIKVYYKDLNRKFKGLM